MKKKNKLKRCRDCREIPVFTEKWLGFFGRKITFLSCSCVKRGKDYAYLACAIKAWNKYGHS